MTCLRRNRLVPVGVQIILGTVEPDHEILAEDYVSNFRSQVRDIHVSPDEERVFIQITTNFERAVSSDEED